METESQSDDELSRLHAVDIELLEPAFGNRGVRRERVLRPRADLRVQRAVRGDDVSCRHWYEKKPQHRNDCTRDEAEGLARRLRAGCSSQPSVTGPYH